MIFINNNGSFDPAINLAIEEYTVRNLDIQENYCFLYRNKPCIVIGKNQNLYEEVNYKFIYENNIPVYRRISGGGTVYHDENNLNFSFLTKFQSRKFNKYEQFTSPIVGALVGLGVNAYLNERNDIYADGKKISGNAQFTSRNRMISHGTLLFDADLNVLRNSLRANPEKFESKSSKSVKSSVANVKDYIGNSLEIEEFTRIIAKAIADESGYFGEYHFGKREWTEIKKLAEEKYSSFEWNYGRSPAFVFRNRIVSGSESFRTEIMVSNGCIDKIKLESSHNELEEIGSLLTGCRFNWNDVLDKVEKISGNRISKEVLFELLFT